MSLWKVALAIVGAILSFILYENRFDLCELPVLRNGCARSANHSVAWKVLHHQGGNSPWFRKTDGVVDESYLPPNNCRVDQVHMISRHAERYPTLLSGSRMLELYNRIHEENVTLTGDLSFAMTWPFLTPDPDPPDAFFENLISTGAHAGTLQAFTTGIKFRGRYRNLLDASVAAKANDNENRVINFWSSEAPRVVETAKYFAAGFFGSDWENHYVSSQHKPGQKSRPSYPAILNIIPTNPLHGADTLTPGKNCPNYYDRMSSNNTAAYLTGRVRAYQALFDFRSHFLPPIIARLEAQNPHFALSENEVYSMLELCGFDSIASAEESGWTSPWCDVFTRQEWDAFEYARDVLHYYRSGPGSSFSNVLGRAWVNATTELLRLGPEQGSLFLSFAHDTDVLAIMTSLSLFEETAPLPTTHMPHNRTFHTSSYLPMHGRLTVERLACPVERYCWSNAPFYPNHVYCSPERDEYFVRVNVNDGIIALPECKSGPGQSCPLSEFVGLMENKKDAGSFANACGLNDDVPERITFLKQG
ncbi:Hypothetical protein R9X50_00055300 [Acrodontium crateriforme]|uniref:3-phytase n=1 Tax=Acrodontium crateriforme TaxID=150365 RepID=A0AAQ3M0H2_9PEZI|nr:Hypothetical protein R9X50_00055300 [Acrodontium crateriforme]